MALSLLLMKKILSMMMIAVFGYILVKTGILTGDDARPVSMLIIYVVSPCVFLNAFAQEFSVTKLKGLLLAIAGSILVHIVYIVFSKLVAKLLHMDAAEECSLIYTNAGNLTIPLVTSVMGEEWTYYACAYIMVQTILLWSHCYMKMSGMKKVPYKKILLNPNIIMLFVSLFIFVMRLELPSMIDSMVSDVSALIGPLSMIIIGMSFATADLRKIFLSSPRIYIFNVIKMILYPLIIIFIFRFSGMTLLHEEGSKILLITLIAACAPVASSVTQLAQMFKKGYALTSAYTICSFVYCLITMPLMILIYQLL